MTRTERAVHAGPAARGLTVMAEGRSQNRRSLRILISRSLRARVRVRRTRGGYCTALRQKMPVFTTPETNA